MDLQQTMVSLGQLSGRWLVVLCSLFLVFQMSRPHLALGWRVLLLALCGLLGMVYIPGDSSAWAGLSALWAVFGGWRYLQCRYAGQTGISGLLACSVFTPLTLVWYLWTGLGLVLGLFLFSGFHCFLHEREEQALRNGVISRGAVLRRWGRSWGLYWMLPSVLCSILVIICSAPGLGLGLLPTQGFILPEHTVDLPWGYFSSFHQEFLSIWLGQGAISPGAAALYWQGFGWAVCKSVGLLWVGCLPIVGVLGGGIRVPGRFVYRLLQRPDEELLLFWLCGTCLIVSTVPYATSGTVVANGVLAYLLAVWVCASTYSKWLSVVRLAPRHSLLWGMVGRLLNRV